MEHRGRASHLLPGAITPGGFYSLYHHIAPSDANKVIVLKGGPGVGKSTFMKAIGRDLLARGFDVEFHHCSADNNSIDAIYIPAADTALLDGTAPHVVDPQYPGAVDEIINLGAYWNEAALRTPANREAIIRITRDYKFRFQRVNEALRAAKAYLEEWTAYYEECLDRNALYAASEELIERLLPERLPRAGKARRLFASAVTYDGAVDWLSSLFDGAAKRVIVKGEPGTGKSVILGRLAETALARGLDLDLFQCPMYPDRIDHLLIRQNHIGVITSTWPHEYAPQVGDEVIETGVWVDAARLATFADDIAAARAGYEAAMRREMLQHRLAKKLHDELEQFYIPQMDFTAVEECRGRTFERILELIKARQTV